MRAGVSLLLAGLLAGPALSRAEGQSEALSPTAPTVYLDFIIRDLRGRPVVDIKASELVIFEKDVRQRVRKLRAHGAAGRYEAAYVSSSGYADGATVSVARRGARVSAPNGQEIKMRVVRPVLPMETELARLLEAAPNADDFPLQASVLRFEESPEETQYALVVEVPLGRIAAGRYEAKFELLVRVKNAAGEVVQRERAERSMARDVDASSPLQRMVWTGQARLRPGRYTLEAIVRDATRRVSARAVSFEAKVPAPGPRLSSVALLLDSGAQRFEDKDRTDDPLRLDGQPLMPTLSLTATASPRATVEFFAIAYPDPSRSAPLTAQVELLRAGEVVASQPVGLAPVDERGALRCAGALPIAKLRSDEYQIRLVTRQGEASAQGQANFTVKRPARLPRPTWPTLGRQELAEIMLLGRREEMIARLQRLDRSSAKGDPEVLYLLSELCLSSGAYADAEKAARRAVELTDDETALGEIHRLLGRALTDGEREKVSPGSERLRAAEAVFRKAIELTDGEVESLYLLLAVVLHRLDRGDEARALLSELLERPDLPESIAAQARQLRESPRCATHLCLPLFSFTTSAGERRTSEDLRGKVVLLSFWRSGFPRCRERLPHLKRLDARSSREPFALVGVSWDRERSAMEEFVAQNEITWPQAMDEGGQLSRTLGVVSIPGEVLFDHEGVALGKSTSWDPGARSVLIGRVGDAIKNAKKALAAGGSTPSK